MRFGRTLGIAGVLAALGLASCGPSSESGGKAKQAAPAVTVDARPEDRGTSEERNLEYEHKWDAFYKEAHDTGDALVVGSPSDVDSLNPLTESTAGAADVTGELFLNLTRTNPDFSHAPMLAKSWEFSDDHLELTFHLRDDVYWHDGVRTTADDVKFTYEKQISPAIGWSAIKWKQFIKDCVVIDDNTVRFVFEKVYPYQLMDAVVGEILPKHILEKIPDEQWKSCDFNRHPVGNGPFKFKEWKAQQYVELEANENFFAGRPPLNRIIFRVIPEPETLLLELKSGQIDLWQGVAPRYYAELARVKDLQGHVYPGRNYTYLGWNLKNALFASKKVRQALTMAIDRQQIIDALLYGFAQPCNGPIAPIIWAYDPNLPAFPYDPAKAKQYLAEEGWKDTDGDGWLDKDGQRFSFALKTNKGNKDREDVVVMIQDMLKQVGIDARPNPMEFTVLVSDLDKRDFEAVVMGWSVGLKMDMTDLWHSGPDHKFNFVSYDNPEFDKLNDEAILEMDREKAKQMWWRCQEMIAEDQPYTFLYTPKTITFVNKRFHNVQIESVGWSYNLEQWWVPKAEQKY